MESFDPAAPLERLSALDPAADVLTKVADQVLADQSLRDLLHGVWKGTPLHPVLTDVTIGAWTSAAILDLLPGNRAAATTLVAAGAASAAPTAVTGLADFARLHPPHKRVGVVHAGANTVALLLYLASLKARLSGHHLRGRALGFAGFAVAAAGGHLGGHLAFRQAAGANHTADVEDLFPSGWQQVGPVEELPDGRPAQRTVGGIDLLLVRRGGAVDVLVDKCSHLSGPLSDGELRDGCIVCPWHGSTFRLTDGAPVHGPAVSPQPVLETRVVDGRVEVRLPQAG